MSRRGIPVAPRAPEPNPNPLVVLRKCLGEARAVGATFRQSGVDVVVDSPAPLPAPMQQILEQYGQPLGLLWQYLGGDRQGEPSKVLLRRLDIKARLITSRADARSAVRQLILDLHQHSGHLGIDIETAPLQDYGALRPAARLKKDGGFAAVQPTHNDRTGLDPHRADIAALQLYAGGDTCFVFRGDALRMVAASHWLRRQQLVAHNAGFELSFLQRHPARPWPSSRSSASSRPSSRTSGVLHCSMQATGLLVGVAYGGGRSLTKAAQAYLGLDLPKGLQTSEWGARRLSPGQLAYAALDAIIAWRLWPLLYEQLQTTGRIEAYELQRRAIPAVVAMERRGLGFDPEEHQRQVTMWSADLTQARQDYSNCTGNAPPTTPAQLRTWLETVLPAEQLATWPRTEKTTVLSTAYKDLVRLGAIPSARPVLILLAKEKLLSTFGPSLVEQVNPVTSRIHADYNLAATKAGRFSASHPNLQQLPSKRAPEFRRCIVAAPGNLLVGCDWNQVEVRAAAWVSGDPVLTELYQSGADLHLENAALIGGVPLSEVTKEMRGAAKAVTFGALYGVGAKTLAINAFKDFGVDLTVAEAQAARNTFFARFRVLDRWRRDHADRCQARGYIEIGCGRVVEAAWEPFGLSFPQCCNLPIQGICADAMLRALILVHHRFIAAGIRGGLVATVHDELLCEVVEEDAEQTKHILQQAMIEAFEVTFPGAPTNKVAKAASGRTWADLK